MLKRTKELAVAIASAAPIICVVSQDEQLVVSDLKACYPKAGIEVWSCTHKLGPIAALNQINSRVTLTSKILVFFDFHKFINDTDICRKLKELAQEIPAKGVLHQVVLVSPYFELPVELDKYVSYITYGTMSDDEIHARVLKIEPKAVKDPRVLDALRGLTTFEVDDLVNKSLSTTGAVTVSELLKGKKVIVQKSGVLDYYESCTSMQEVGGLPHLKKWITSRHRAYTPEGSAEKLPLPKGILLTGIPGTGKSLVAKAISSEWGVPLLRLDVGSLFGQYVGQSEERARQALRTAERTAPCILWIDEIEKGLRSDTGDSGTSTRVLATILSWMQEKTAPVFVVATANDVTKLPPELYRRGRFDEVFYFGIPDAGSCGEIVDICMARYGVQLPEKKKFRWGQSDVYHSSVQSPLGEPRRKIWPPVSYVLTGAEIEQAIVNLLYTTRVKPIDGIRSVTTEEVSDSLMGVNSILTSDRDRIKELDGWATRNAKCAGLTGAEKEVLWRMQSLPQVYQR